MTGPSDQGPGPEPREEQVGSVGEEAAKLLGALQDWANEHTGGQPGTGARAEAGAEDAPGHGHSPHVTGDAPECHWCPLCRTVHAVRTASPEVKAQLATAGQALLQAAAGLLTAATQDRSGADTRRPGTVQRIDLDADDEHEPPAQHDPHQEDDQ
jgi:hypothetical protein